MSTAIQNSEDFISETDEALVWPAFLNMDCSGSVHGSRLMGVSHRGPLYVQKPFYPEGKDCVHIYPLHPPGGVVSGDELKINLVAQDKASVLITTPGATRLYKARKPAAGERSYKQKLSNRIKISDGSSVEWLPMETIVFNESDTVSKTRVDLDDSSVFLGWEVCCLGLPASNKPFESGHLSLSFEIFKNEKPVLVDKLSFSAESPVLTAKNGLDSSVVSGIFVAGPGGEMQNSVNDDQAYLSVEEVLDSIRNKMVALKAENKFSITYFNGFYLCRYLGSSAEQARELFLEAWRVLRPVLLKRTICPPRIWAT